jgi:hypothetical protein
LTIEEENNKLLQKILEQLTELVNALKPKLVSKERSKKPEEPELTLE